MLLKFVTSFWKQKETSIKIIYIGKKKRIE